MARDEAGWLQPAYRIGVARWLWSVRWLIARDRRTMQRLGVKFRFGPRHTLLRPCAARTVSFRSIHNTIRAEQGLRLCRKTHIKISSACSVCRCSRGAYNNLSYWAECVLERSELFSLPTPFSTMPDGTGRTALIPSSKRVARVLRVLCE